MRSISPSTTAHSSSRLDGVGKKRRARKERTRWLGWSLIATATWLAGCTTMLDARKDAEFQNQAPVANRPVVRPVRSLSSFSSSLQCMDQMLREAQLPTTLVTSKSIPDYSGRVAVGTKEMVITALSQMSRLSNAFRFVDFEVDIARQDTVQNLTTILLNNNQLQLQRPALYISGAIAFVDQNIINTRHDVGLSGPRIEVGNSAARNATVIALEMHLGDFRTRTFIPGLDSANEVVIGTGGQGLDLAGRIGTYGVQFNVGRDYTQGTGPAVRTLVELAMIELIGKWARVPYWQCLTLEQNHPEFQRQLYEWWREGEPAIRRQLVKRSLISRGYLSAGSESLPDQDPKVRAAIGQFQSDQGITISGLVDFPTYESALRDFVGITADGALSRVGWAPTATAQSSPASDDPAAPRIAGIAPVRPGTPAEAATSSAIPRTVNLQIENQLLGRNAFEVGEQIFLSATVSRSSYLQCYLADARGQVMRLIPNRSNPSGWVPAGHALRIPDWMSPMPGFIMDASAPGSEQVACFATDTDRAADLPAPLQQEALRPMQGVRGLDAVNQWFGEALGAGQYTVQKVHWNVIPKRVAPAALPAASNGKTSPPAR